MSVVKPKECAETPPPCGSFQDNRLGLARVVMRSLWAQDHISADPGGNNDVRCKSRSTTHLRHMSCPSPLPLVLLLKALAHLPPAGRLRSSEGLEPKAPRTGRGGGAHPDHEGAASRHFFGNGRQDWRRGGPRAARSGPALCSKWRFLPGCVWKSFANKS